MANSATVAALDDILASQYNNLRLDVLDLTTGHTHDGSSARNTGFSLAGLTLASGGVDITQAGNFQVTLHATAGNSGIGVRYLNSAASGNKNWFAGANLAALDQFEITPSTAADGTTFSTPAFKITAAGVCTVAGALTVTTGGIAITGNSTITGTLGGLTGLTVASGGATVTGNSTIGSTISTLVGLLIAPAETGDANNTAETAKISGGLTKSGSTGDLRGLNITSSAITVNGSVTCDRAAQLFVGGVTATVTGTLTAHNAAYFGTPVNGSTVRVIDSASGGYLTTGGVWTDNVSWAALKRDITPVTIQEQTALLNWFATDYKPVRYRYADTYETMLEDDGSSRQVLTCYERDDVDYPHLGFLLDDLPQSLREIVCADTSGGISGKDVGGLALALLQVTAQRIRSLEARLAKAGIN